MSENPALGRLESVHLRDGWQHEANDFTPWLYEEESIRLLGAALGLDLEAEGREVWVGPFRADILARDRTNNVPVLIENQLEPTDHGHLGAIMTYAAGLDAANIVWIASQFVDQHRAALDWLNRVTVEGVNFFGVEVELWRIDDSPPAPKFNVVSKPNEWTKQVTRVPKGGDNPNYNEYQAFWTGLVDVMKKGEYLYPAPKPIRRSWLRTPSPPLPRSIWVNISYNLSDGLAKLYVLVYNKEHPDLFQFVSERAELLREGLDQKLVQEPTETDAGGWFGWNAPASVAGKENWSAQHEWLVQALRAVIPRLAGVFKEYETTRSSTA